MRTAAPPKGRDHDTLLQGPAAVVVIMLLAVLATEWPASHAAAQGPPCTAIQDDAERLACYDRALRAGSAAPAAPAAQAPTAAVTQPPAPAAQAPAGQAPTAQAPAAQASPAPASTTTPAAPRTAERSVIPIVIVAVRAMPGRETTFTTQDGNTWVQTDSQRVSGLPDTPFDAELKPGAVGSTFLVPKVGSRAIRVRLAER